MKHESECDGDGEAPRVVLDVVVSAFVKLREAWYYARLTRCAPEREWETEEQEADRVGHNLTMKLQYDKDTDAIMRGEHREIAPHCAAQLERTT